MSRPDGLGPLDGLEICDRCRTLRGRCVPSLGNSRRPRVQECLCERRARPPGEENPEWHGFDIPKAVELCYCCGLVPLRSGSRWCPWFCRECATRAGAFNTHLGRPVVPIGRHSMMHGIGLRAGTGPDAEIDDTDAIEEFCLAANSLFLRMNQVQEWMRLRVGFNVERLDFDTQSPVPLETYLAAARASRDPELTSQAAFRAMLQRMSTIARVEAS